VCSPGADVAVQVRIGTSATMDSKLPPIPAKRYFTISEVGELCAVKPYVLRYWEREFTQLRPMKRRGNRRYYQHHEILMIRRIRELVHVQGLSIEDARRQLQQAGPAAPVRAERGAAAALQPAAPAPRPGDRTQLLRDVAAELRAIRHLLDVGPRQSG
jgi:DNA-binding transcriptional MerR regulator